MHAAVRVNPENIDNHVIMLLQSTGRLANTETLLRQLTTAFIADLTRLVASTKEQTCRSLYTGSSSSQFVLFTVRPADVDHTASSGDQMCSTLLHTGGLCTTTADQATMVFLVASASVILVKPANTAIIAPQESHVCEYFAAIQK